MNASSSFTWCFYVNPFATNIPILFPQLFSDGFREYKLSVIRQKTESQNECFKKTKHAKFSEKRTFVTPWYPHVRKTKDWISKRVFQENEASQIFRKGTFLTSRYAHVYKAKGRISKRVFQENKARQIFQKTNISYLLIRSFALLTCAYQGIRFVFRKMWRALFSWNTRLEIRPFVLLPTTWEYWPQMNWLFVHSFQGNVLLYLNAKYWIPGSITVKLNIWLNFNRWLRIIFLMKL